MPTREEMQNELRQQRASARPTVAPDILGHTKLARQARAQDARNKHEALTNPHHKPFSQVVDIGTDAVYSTLPANAAKINETQNFTVDFESANALTVLSYTVPLGRVLYLHHVSMILTGETYPGLGIAIIPSALIPVTIRVNGSADVWNQGILVDPLGNGINCHVIIPAGQTVSIYASFASVTNLGALTGYCSILGDILLGNDMPEPYTALQPRGR